MMPDHIHLVWMGTGADSDQRKGMVFLRTYTERLFPPGYRFQHQAHDHVLRPSEGDEDAFQSACYYIALNPVRKGLVEDWRNWNYSGCLVTGYPKLDPRDTGYWELLWRIYFGMCESSAKRSG
ncbi:MAG: hypothetical protein JNJ83_09785 [Verrucomicrobiaceae bacterium]|nr:hypothetical protein [Verrucomicrobiaceae bacterium]